MLYNCDCKIKTLRKEPIFMNKLDIVYNCLISEGVQTVVTLPDSHLCPLCRKIKNGKKIDYIQTVDESIAVGISTGLRLTGNKSLVIMENSGLRKACETISRFNLSHRLFTAYLISHRGFFGERNWWGVAHHETMEPLLNLLKIRWAYVQSVAEFSKQLKNLYLNLETNQCSTALIIEQLFIEEL